MSRYSLLTRNLTASHTLIFRQKILPQNALHQPKTESKLRTTPLFFMSRMQQYHVVVSFPYDVKRNLVLVFILADWTARHSC